MTSKISVTGKEPWLAVTLSTLFPGVGQIYAGKILKGIILIFLTLSLIGLGGWLVVSPTGSVLLGFQVFIGYFIVSIFNLFDAHRSAKKANNSEFERLRKGDKDPWLAVFLSRMIPGLGHAYQGQWLFALLFLVLILGSAALSLVFPLAIVICLISIYVCFYHAYLSSPTRRATSKRLILSFCLALFIFDLFNQFVSSTIKGLIAEARYIPSPAMLPTLEIGDRLIINKLDYRFKLPQRKDIIVFNPIPELQQRNYKDPFIKRIIGLPGETIQVKAGKVYINNQPLPENYISEPPTYQFGPVRVPPHSYFVLGDNRNNSFDSHYWGFVPKEYIIGRASKIFWPLPRAKAI